MHNHALKDKINIKFDLLTRVEIESGHPGHLDHVLSGSTGSKAAPVLVSAYISIKPIPWYGN